MKRHTSPSMGRQRRALCKKRNRRPKIWLQRTIYEEWRQNALTHRQTHKDALEEAVKATELFYAGFSDGEISLMFHSDNLITLLTPPFLLRRALLTENGGASWQSMRISVSKETYERAMNVAHYTELPISFVFSLAVHFAVIVSDPTIVDFKPKRHPLFLSEE